MLRKNIRIPKQIRSLRDLDKANAALSEASKFDRLELDFRWTQFGEPFPTLYLAHRVNEIRRDCPETDIQLLMPSNPGSGFLGYAQHVGFFDFMGFDFGRKVGDAFGSTRYIPIKSWQVSDYTEKLSPVGELVDEEAARLTEVLTQSTKGALFDLVQYSIREIARNSFEHSDGSSVTILAQYYPTTHRAEIVVFDDGIGIEESLSGNDIVDISNNLAAIKVALLPGITGVPRSERINQTERWGIQDLACSLLVRFAESMVTSIFCLKVIT